MVYTYFWNTQVLLQADGSETFSEIQKVGGILVGNLNMQTEDIPQLQSQVRDKTKESFDEVENHVNVFSKQICEKDESINVDGCEGEFADCWQNKCFDALMQDSMKMEQKMNILQLKCGWRIIARNSH